MPYQIKSTRLFREKIQCQYRKTDFFEKFYKKMGRSTPLFLRKTVVFSEEYDFDYREKN